MVKSLLSAFLTDPLCLSLMLWYILLLDRVVNTQGEKSQKILLGQFWVGVYITKMPNMRAPGQKLLTLPADEQFIEAMDRGLRACGYSNRSQFVRDAIQEKLRSIGVGVPKGLAAAPPRAGKGGATRYTQRATPAVALNDAPASPVDESAKRLLAAHVPTDSEPTKKRKRRKSE